MTEIYPGCFLGTTLNGLQVLVEPMPGFRGAALGVWIRAGGREDLPGKEGLAHFVEHMTFKGTVKHSALELAQHIDALGGHLNAATTPEYTFFYTEVLNIHLAEALEVLHELVTMPRFSPEDLARERVVISEEIRTAEDDPEDVVFRVLGETLWTTRHPLGKPVIGRLDSVESIELEDLWGFFRRHYHSGEMVLVACGGVEPEDFLNLVQSLDWREKCDNVTLRTPPKAAAGLSVAEKEIHQAHLALGFPTVSASAPERYALEVLNSRLGGGVSSRLFQRLREEQGLVYAVFSATAYFSDAGFLAIYAAAEEKKLPQVAAAVWQEIEELARTPLPKEEVDQAIQRLSNSFLLNLDDPSSRMVRLGTVAALGRNPISAAEVLQKFAEVNSKAVQELAQKFLRPEKAAWAAVGPSANSLRRALKNFVEVKI